MHRVTAVIPTKDQEPGLLQRAIDSALAAKVAEVLVVVDRSQPFGDAPPRCRVLLSPGKGISAALNEGIRKASHKRIAFLDSDDAWLPGKDDQFRHPEPATFTDYIRHGQIVSCDRPVENIHSDNIPCRSTTVVDRWLLDLVGGFDETLDYAQDWKLHCQVQIVLGWIRIPRPLAQISDLPLGHTRTADPHERCRQCARVRKEFRHPDKHPLASDRRKYLRGSSEDDELSKL